jgi:glycosyltransferase involved in cell wall biosynthesis
MKVLLLSQYFYPEVGATQTRMFEFARALAADGHDVDVVTEFPNHPTGVFPDRYRGRWLELDGSQPFRIRRVWVFARPRKTFWTRLGFYFSFFVMAIIGSWRLAGRYDVVVATSPPLPVAVAGFVISRLKRAAFVMDVRDLWPKAAQALGELSDGWFYRLAERLEEALYRRSDLITVTTRAFMRDIGGRVPALASSIQLVPNGTLDAVFDPARGDAGLRTRLGLDGKFVVAYVGLHGLAQGLGTVLDAAGLLKAEDDIRFVFVGEGPLKQALMARVEAEGLPNVRFLDQVPLAQSAHYMNLADALVVPLTADPVFEMFVPSKMFDAMACAKPVLLMVGGEARAILDDACAGLFVPPGDTGALCSAVAELKRHPERGTAMGTAGRQYVTRHYRRSDQAHRFATLVSDVASRRGAMTPESYKAPRGCAE